MGTKLTCRVCSPEIEVEHEMMPLILDDGKESTAKVLTCVHCGNQKRTEKQNSPIEVTHDAEKKETRVGTKDEGIIITQVEGEPNKEAILPEHIVEGLGLKPIYRAIGLCLEQKIPLYESEVGMAAIDYMNKATTKLYITKYDLIATPCNDMFMIKKWCIYLERSINGKDVKAGAYLADEKISDIETVKSVIREIDSVINKKFGD